MAADRGQAASSTITGNWRARFACRPRLLELHLRPETRQIAETLLALSIRTWPGSVVETVNGLAERPAQN